MRTEKSGKVGFLVLPAEQEVSGLPARSKLEDAEAEQEEELIHLTITKPRRNINHQCNDRALARSCHREFSSLVPK